MLYVPTKERSYFSTISGVGAAFFPLGANLPGAEGLDVFEGAFEQLQPIGTYTPWASRIGSMDWEVVEQPPETNIALGHLDDSLYKRVVAIGFGTQLPFIAVLTEQLPTPSALQSAFSGTSYRLYETQAVYNQLDKGEPPRIQFIHWMALRNQDDAESGNGSLSAAASVVGGKLGVAMQVNYQTTSTRNVPSDSFENALANQFAAPTPPSPSPSTPTLPQDPPQAQIQGKMTAYKWGVAAAIALTCGAGAYVVYNSMSRKG